MINFETWWEREGQEFLYALNTTTDDDIKLVAEVAWKNGAYCAEQAGQEPVVRATLAPPAPPEVYQMRSRDAYEAGWYEAQKQKAVSPTAPVQPIEDSRVSMWKSRYLAAASDRSKLIEENHALRAATFRTKDLTDEEIWEAYSTVTIPVSTPKIARAVIAKFKEKNK